MLAGVHELPWLHGTQVPLPLQTPPVQELPADLLVVAVHVWTPVLQAVTPFMHAFDGVHVRLIVQSIHAPPEQTRFVPQEAPLVIAFPVSVQTPTPVEQEMVPVWQGLDGVHASPSWHATHTPVLLHTMPVPQEVPGDLFPLSVHACVPVEHEFVPTLHGLAG